MGKHKDRKKHKKLKQRSESSSSGSSSDEWVEKEAATVCTKTPATSTLNTQDSDNNPSLTEDKHEEWMSLPTSFSAVSHLELRQDRQRSKQHIRDSKIYNPRTYSRELNPYWKGDGDGLPKFQQPNTDIEGGTAVTTLKYHHNLKACSSGWKKKSSQCSKECSSESPGSSKVAAATEDISLNAIAAKLLKAEIIGDKAAIENLSKALDAARKQQPQQTDEKTEKTVLLTETDAFGRSRPLHQRETSSGADGRRPAKRQKVETHRDGQRIRYFGDDDRYSLHQMFENEKFTSTEQNNLEFANMSRSRIGKDEDLDDLFTDRVRTEVSDEVKDLQQRHRAISEDHKMRRSLDDCKMCVQSAVMQKHLMIAMGETIYLCVPNCEPLVEYHCLLAPLRHTSCATQLDENEWAELMGFRRALTRMYGRLGKQVVFFETAKHLKNYPHMVIHCVPLDAENGDLAPIYFKKAIDESEHEWAHNKKLVSMKDRDVRTSVPKGLPYFAVSFGMEEGFAHVIEDEHAFPANFAHEIIGGMLDLHHSKWRKPKRITFDEQTSIVNRFSKVWTPFDCTVNG